MANPRLYKGFLGAEASRFVGQDTTDIHFSDWYNPGPPYPQGIKYRQRATAVAHSMTFISAERLMGPQQPWQNVPGFAANIQVMNHGPCQQAHLLPPQQAPFPQPVTWFVVGGQLVMGYFLPWYHELDETYMGDQPFHYYEHERRDDHQRTPLMKPNGKHHMFACLHFGTQVQEYRRAR